MCQVKTEETPLTRREEGEVDLPIAAAAVGCLRMGCIAAAADAGPVPGTGSTTCLLGLQVM
jgi:hypothetical protein